LAVMPLVSVKDCSCSAPTHVVVRHQDDLHVTALLLLLPLPLGSSTTLGIVYLGLSLVVGYTAPTQ
jgi:hypothetical protein